MISLPRRTTLVLGTLAAVTMAGSAFAGDTIRNSERCAVYGAGYVELGNGACGQVGHTRIGDASGWTGAGAANAGLRSDGVGMLPGAGNARHLRIQAYPDYR